MSKTAKIIFGVVLVVIVALALYFLINSLVGPTRLSFSEFVERVDAYISENGSDGVTVYIDPSSLVYTFLDRNGTSLYYAYGPSPTSTKSPSLDRLCNLIGENGIVEDYANINAGSYWSYLIPVIGIILVCVVFWLLIRQTQGGNSKAMSFAKSKARVNQNIKVRFSDVAGAEEEKQELAEVVEFLKAPRKFSDLGARIPKGILLVGPPGTGKTLFAKAVAGEANVPFFSISGSDFVEMFVGVGASRVRDLFDAAKKSQPCIVFIDEIDAVGRQRGTGLGGGHDEREQTLNQLLVQMDGFETNEGIIVMAATNRADILDPALLRPGRFDRQIHVNLPDVRGRESILKVHARNKPLEADVNFKVLARMTSGFSGADLENLLNEAAILAARANKKMIGNRELFEGINKVLLGPQKKSRLVTEADKRITAYHESGHAIIAKLCKNCDPVQEVSIIARGMAAGYTMTRPDNDDNHMTQAKLTDFVCELLGGRVAEEIVIKDVSTGASNDLQRVTELARKMVTEWGMSERVGLVTYKSDNPIFLGRDMEAHSGYSEETAGIIDEEVRKIIESAHARAVELLSTHRSVLDNMARVLIERETIYTDEVDMLLDGATVEEVYAHMDSADKKAEKNPFDRFTKGGKGDADGAKKAENTADGKSGAASPEEAVPVEYGKPADEEEKGAPEEGAAGEKGGSADGTDGNGEK